MPLTLKRKAPEADPSVRPPSAIPSTLPPSVEEAYRRRCVQLKNRTNEVEDANDAARLRLARIKRQVEKLRIERAFLLEQLAKRTSTNVEDSDGSPSPPPTDLASLAELMVNPRKPKDKPLRTKRGHRKSMAVDVDAKATAAGSFTTNQAQSPVSETGSHHADGQGKERPNGVSKKPVDAFEVYCTENRAALEAKKKEEEEGDEDLNVEEDLARSWKELPDAEKEEFQTKFERAVAKIDEKKESSRSRESKEGDEENDDNDGKKEHEEEAEANVDKEKSESAEKPRTQDEDVEMGNYDTEDQDTQAGEKAEPEE